MTWNMSIRQKYPKNSKMLTNGPKGSIKSRKWQKTPRTKYFVRKMVVEYEKNIQKFLRRIHMNLEPPLPNHPVSPKEVKTNEMRKKFQGLTVAGISGDKHCRMSYQAEETYVEIIWSDAPHFVIFDIFWTFGVIRERGAGFLLEFDYFSYKISDPRSFSQFLHL